VRERQEQQRRVVLVEHLLETVVLHAVADIGNEVAVAQHAALRAAGRAGGVHDLGEISGAPGEAAFLNLFRRDRRPAHRDVGQAAEPAAVDLPDMSQRGKPAPRLCDPLGVIVGLHHDGNRARVAEDPFDLLERGGGIDRYGDSASGQDRVVQDSPLEPRPGPAMYSAGTEISFICASPIK
jgi:hypothetical protein